MRGGRGIWLAGCLCLLAALNACAELDTVMWPASAPGIDTASRTSAAAAGGQGGAAIPAAQGEGLGEGREPLMVIRFDAAADDYQPILLSTLGRALERQPQLALDVVAFAPALPANGGPLIPEMLRRSVGGVLRDLASLGISGDRVRLSATTGPQTTVQAVHLYVR